MSNGKQVAPPFGVIKQIAKPEDEPLTTLVPDGEAPVQRVEQTPEQVMQNTNEYWATGGGSIGGLELGNRSGVNPFAGKPVNEKNPFAEKKPVVKEEVTTLLEAPEGTPAWREVVSFVMTHGKDIIGVRYPNPPLSTGMPIGRGWATVIDTTWSGVPVFVGPECEIQHKVAGWAKWTDCQA